MCKNIGTAERVKAFRALVAIVRFFEFICKGLQTRAMAKVPYAQGRKLSEAR
jgi:hypothetical protein